MPARFPEVTDIEVVEDFSATARCDEGFLRVRRLRCRNTRADGSHSKIYRVDVVDRPRVDAVAVLVWRRDETGEVEVLLRDNLRPAALFRRELRLPVPDGRSYLHTREIVAGLLEPEDRGEEGILNRAAAETWEEAGLRVAPAQVRMLGGPFFVAPGILSEKIHLTEVEVTGIPEETPPGDGSPLEEGAALHWAPIAEVREACVRGDLEDAKTELAVRRLLDRLPYRPG
jgi:ADP-ribose pyrophosphatase